MTDLKAVAQQFFAAYDGQDIEGMIACFSDVAKAWYAPYGRDSVMPIRGGIDAIWRTFQKVPGIHVKVDEMLVAEGNTVVARVWVIGGPHAVEVPGVIKKGQTVPIPHLFLLRIDQGGKIGRLDCYFDNTVLGGVKSSAL